VRAAERGQEIVESVVVGKVDRCELQTPPILVSPEEVVIPNREIEEIAVRDAGRVLVVVLRSR